MDSPARFPEFLSLGLNAITLDGLQGSRQGVLRGGFHRAGSSLLDLYCARRDAEDEVTVAKESLAEAEEVLARAAAERARRQARAQSIECKAQRIEEQVGQPE